MRLRCTTQASTPRAVTQSTNAARTRRHAYGRAWLGSRSDIRPGGPETRYGFPPLSAHCPLGRHRRGARGPVSTAQEEVTTRWRRAGPAVNLWARLLWPIHLSSEATSSRRPIFLGMLSVCWQRKVLELPRLNCLMARSYGPSSRLWHPATYPPTSWIVIALRCPPRHSQPTPPPQANAPEALAGGVDSRSTGDRKSARALP